MYLPIFLSIPAPSSPLGPPMITKMICGAVHHVFARLTKVFSFFFRCEYPSKHRGKNLLSIPPDELRCGTPVYKVLVIIALSVVVVLCFALLVFFIVKRKKSKQKAGGPTQVKRIGGANWTIFVLQHTKDQDDVKVSISDEKVLLTDSREFDV